MMGIYLSGIAALSLLAQTGFDIMMLAWDSKIPPPAPNLCFNVEALFFSHSQESIIALLLFLKLDMPKKLNKDGISVSGLLSMKGVWNSWCDLNVWKSPHSGCWRLLSWKGGIKYFSILALKKLMFLELLLAFTWECDDLVYTNEQIWQTEQIIT